MSTNVTTKNGSIPSTSTSLTEISIEMTTMKEPNVTSMEIASEGTRLRASSRGFDDLVRELGVDANHGLSTLQVSERQRDHGFNELTNDDEVGDNHRLLLIVVG